MLFGGTIRYNLDPFNNYSDYQLWRVLEQVSVNVRYALPRHTIVHIITRYTILQTEFAPIL